MLKQPVTFLKSGKLKCRAAIIITNLLVLLSTDSPRIFVKILGESVHSLYRSLKLWARLVPNFMVTTKLKVAPTVVNQLCQLHKAKSLQYFYQRLFLL